MGNTVKRALAGGALGAAAVAALLVAAPDNTPTEDLVTLSTHWSAARDSAGAPAGNFYEWTLYYRVRVYRSGFGYEPEARGIIAAGTTSDTAASVQLERPHPLDSLFTWYTIRALERRGRPGAVSRSPVRVVVGYPDSVVVFHDPWANDSIKRYTGGTIDKGWKIQLCVQNYKWGAMYSTTCPVFPAGDVRALVLAMARYTGGGDTWTPRSIFR